MKIKNKLWVSVCAFFTTLCTAFGVAQLSTPTKTVAEQAASSTGLTEATLSRVDSTVTTAGTMDSVAFDGFTAGTASATYFMVDFVGQNLPNFVVNATQVYDAYTADNYATVGNGMLFSSTAGSNRLALTSGIVGKSQWGDLASETASSITSITTWEFTDPVSGLGLAFLQENEHYIAVLGYEPTGAQKTTINYSFYLFKETNGTLNKIATVLATDGVGNATGQYAVIYPNIDYGPEEITFSYATPKTSLNNLLLDLDEGYAYKSQLMKSLNVSAPIGEKATLDAMTISTGSGTTVQAETDIDFIEFDGLSGNTFFMVEFSGQNVPNFAVRATKGYSEITATGTDEWSNAGIMLLTSSTNAWNDLYVWRGFHANGSADNKGTAVAGAGYNMYSATGHYVFIAGYEIVEGSTSNEATVSAYVYSVGADNTLTEFVKGSKTISNISHALSGTKAVIYPNSKVNQTLGADTVTFNYVAPKASLAELIMGVDDNCAYKSQLLTAHNISTKTLTMQNSKGNVIGTKTVLASANYTLPTGNIANFVGWEYNEALYGVGDTIEASENITVKAVCLEMDVLDGASARLKIDDDGNGGLRFTVKAKTADLTALGANVEMHGVLIPTDMINGEFDLNEAGAKDIVLSNSVALDDGYTYYYITLTDVIYSNYNRAFSARAYAKITYADEGTANMAATAYDVANNSRSIYDVAVAAYNDGEEADGILAQYIGYTVNLSYSVNASDEYVFSVVDTEDGVTAASIRKYSIVSQNVTTEEGITGVTVTIKLTDLPTTLSLEKVPVTVWAEGSTKGERMDITVQSTDEAQGTVTCFFQLA